MKILSKTKFNNNDEYYNRLPLPSQVIRLGDYLRKHLSFVYNVERPPNEYVIYATMMYMIEPEARKVIKKYPNEFHGKEEDVYFVNVYFNITTYAGKYIRVNVIQLDEYEVTLGFLRLDRVDLMSLPDCKKKIVEFAETKIEERYKKMGYEIQL